jgi:hypothetical protein
VPTRRLNPHRPYGKPAEEERVLIDIAIQRSILSLRDLLRVFVRLTDLIFLSVVPQLEAVGFGASEQLLGRDFSPRHGGGDGVYWWAYIWSGAEIRDSRCRKTDIMRFPVPFEGGSSTEMEEDVERWGKESQVTKNGAKSQLGDLNMLFPCKTHPKCWRGAALSEQREGTPPRRSSWADTEYLETREVLNSNNKDRTFS